MTTLNRRAFCKKLHSILNWQTYDTHAEYQAVVDARKLFECSDLTSFVEARNNGCARSAVQTKVDELKELLACTLDEAYPLKSWRHGRLRRN